MHIYQKLVYSVCTDDEGLCKSVLEAMMVGIPVLCSDVPALNGYIDHGINGLGE